MEKKELSMEVRLLIAFVLVGLILFVYPYFYKEPATPSQSVPESKALPTAVSKSSAVAIPAPTAPAAAQAAGGAVPGAIEGGDEKIFTVDTDYYHVEFSNRGAVVRRWQLKKYRDHDFGSPRPVPIDLVNPQALSKVPAPFSLAYKKDQNPSTDANTRLYQVQQPNDMTVNFEFSDGRLDVKKSFRFLPKSYLVAVDSTVTQNGAPLPHSLAWRGGFGDSTENNAITNQHALYYDSANSKLNVKQVKEAKDGPVSWAWQFSFAGL